MAADLAGLAAHGETDLGILPDVVQFHAGQGAVEQDPAIDIGIVEGHDVWPAGYGQAQVAYRLFLQDLFHLVAGVYEFFG
jgi:hypothetical protein